MNLVGKREKQISARERINAVCRAEAHVALNQKGELKAVLVVVPLQRGDGVRGGMIAEHPHARNLQSRRCEYLASLGIDGFVHPCNGLRLHHPASFIFDFV